MHHLTRRPWFLCALLPLLLAACAQAIQPQQYPGPEEPYPGPEEPYPGLESPTPFTPSATSLTPADTPIGPTGTPTRRVTPQITGPTSTASLTPSSTPTATPTGPTGTPTPTLLYLDGTPLPSPQPIDESNAWTVSGLARFEIPDLVDLEWAPQGELLAAANPSTIFLFEALERELVQELEAGDDTLDISFSPDNVWLASGGYRGSEQTGYRASIRIWRGPGTPFTPTPRPTATSGPSATPARTGTATPPGGAAPSATPSPSISPTGGTLIPSATSATETQTITPSPSPSPTTQPALAHSSQPNSGNSGASTGFGGLVAGLLEEVGRALFPPGQAVTPTPEWETRGVLFVERRPLSRLTFTPGSDSLVTVWSSPEIKPHNVVEFRNTLTWQVTRAITTTTILDLAFSPDGSRLATAPHRYAIEVYDLDRTGDPSLVFHTSFTGAVNSLAFSADGVFLATGHYDGIIRIWDLAQGKQTIQFDAGGVVESLAFHPGGQLLASGVSYPRYVPGQSGNPVQIWSLTQPGLVRTLTGHTNGVTRLAFSPSGSLLASASYDGSIWLWGLP